MLLLAQILRVGTWTIGLRLPDAIKVGGDLGRELGEIVQPLVQKLVQPRDVDLDVPVDQQVAKAGNRAKAGGENRVQDPDGREGIEG